MATLSYDKSKESLFLSLDRKDKVKDDLFGYLRDSGFQSVVPMKYNSSKRAILYDLSGLISMKVRLQNTVEIDEFYLILYNFYKSMLHLFSNGVEPNKIDWTSDLIFINEDCEVKLLGYPLELKTLEGKDIFNVLRIFIEKARPFGASDGKALEYLNNQLEKVSSGKISKEKFISALKMLVESYYEENLKDYEPIRLKAIMNGVETVEERKKREEIKVEVGGVSLDMTGLNVEVQERTGLLQEDSDDLSEDDKTQILVEEEDSTFTLVLTRQSGEVIELYPVEHSVSIFGKALRKGNSDVDYELANNSMISRKHFEISYLDGDFYINDLGSTNGTFLDNVKVTEKTKLYDGSILKIANEVCTISFKAN